MSAVQNEFYPKLQNLEIVAYSPKEVEEWQAKKFWDAIAL